MTDERPPQMQPSLHRQRRAPLDLLRHDFRQQIGLGEVLRADDHAIPSGARSTQDDQQHQRSRTAAARRACAPRVRAVRRRAVRAARREWRPRGSGCRPPSPRRGKCRRRARPLRSPRRSSRSPHSPPWRCARGEDDRRGERQLDEPQQLTVGHAHPPTRLAHRRVNAAIPRRCCDDGRSA